MSLEIESMDTLRIVYESFPKSGSFSVTQTSFVLYNMVDGQKLWAWSIIM